MDVQIKPIPFLQEIVVRPRIAICGMGMVGGALAKIFDDPILYDPPKGIGSKKELNTADIVFVCVPTPYKEGFDLSIVKSVIEELEGEKIVVIKSTVVPGTTYTFQSEYPQHKFIFNPEFLTEVTSDQDMRYPDRQIIGYTNQSYTIATDIMNLLPLAPYSKIMPAKEAEMVKYFNNTWFATKVIFANQIYDLCQKLGIDYDTVKDGASADKRMTGTSHLQVVHKGFRGYGGKCIPKDAKALISFADSKGVDMKLLKQVDSINEEILKSQGLKEKP